MPAEGFALLFKSPVTVRTLQMSNRWRQTTNFTAGNVWKVEVEECAEVKQGDPLVIVESMKMAYAVTPPEIAASARCYAAKAGRCRLSRICRYFLLSNQSAYSTAIVRIMMDIGGHAWV